jgi:hypothetical protein
LALDPLADVEQAKAVTEALVEHSNGEPPIGADFRKKGGKNDKIGPM